jgi:hypothetical protein
MRLLMFLLLVCTQSCAQRSTNAKLYDQYLTQQIEARDSMFVLYTVKVWGQLNWWTYHDYSKLYHMTND